MQNRGWREVAGDGVRGHAKQSPGEGEVSWESPEEVHLLRELGNRRRAEMSSGNNHATSQKDEGYPFLTFQSLELGRLVVFAIFSHLFLDLFL